LGSMGAGSLRELMDWNKRPCGCHTKVHKAEGDLPTI